jgi:uncharacterized protein (DUF362 family)
MERNELLVIYGDDPAAMTRALLEEIHPEREIPTGGRVVLKPNLVVAKKSDSGATTHTEIVRATIEYLRGHGVNDLLLAEGSWVGDDTKRAFRVSGFERLAQEMDIPMLDLKDDEYETVTSDGIAMQISKTVLAADYLISFPVLKGHCQTNMTCALKNMKGCLSDRSKRMFHTLGLHRPIAALNAVRCADLVLADSLCGDLDFEEGGNPVRTDRMIAAKDSVLLDSYGTRLLGFELDDVPYIRLAEQLGVGSTDLSQAKINELNRAKSAAQPVSTRRIRALEGYVDSRDACSACYGNLIHALSRLEEQGLLDGLYTAVYNGQAFRGQELCGIGIGECCNGAPTCVHGCPPSAQDIVHALRAAISDL